MIWASFPRRHDLGVERIDVESDPDHDRAVVVGPGQRRGDRDQRLSGAPLNGPDRYIFPDRVEGMGTRAGGHVRGADLAEARATRIPFGSMPPASSRRGDRGLRAVWDAAKVAGEAGRNPEVELAEELVPVIAVELENEGAEVPGDRVGGPGSRRGLEGPDLPGAGGAAGARS